MVDLLSEDEDIDIDHLLNYEVVLKEMPWLTGQASDEEVVPSSTAPEVKATRPPICVDGGDVEGESQGCDILPLSPASSCPSPCPVEELGDATVHYERGRTEEEMDMLCAATLGLKLRSSSSVHDVEATQPEGLTEGSAPPGAKVNDVARKSLEASFLEAAAEDEPQEALHEASEELDAQGLKMQGKNECQGTRNSLAPLGSLGGMDEIALLLQDLLLATLFLKFP